MPFCPQCHDEYDEGYTVCADCGCELVDKLPQQPQEPPDPEPRAMHPVFLYSADDLNSKIIANILEQEGIPVLVRSKTLVGDYISIYSGYSVYGKKLYVDEADQDRAQEILGNFLVAETTGETDRDGLSDDDSMKNTPFLHRSSGRLLILFLVPAITALVLWLASSLS